MIDAILLARIEDMTNQMSFHNSNGDHDLAFLLRDEVRSLCTFADGDDEFFYHVSLEQMSDRISGEFKVDYDAHLDELFNSRMDDMIARVEELVEEGRTEDANLLRQESYALIDFHDSAVPYLTVDGLLELVS